jgi:hypothetical protein
LFPHVTDAAAILYGSVFTNGSAATMRTFSTHFTLMLCRYSITVYPCMCRAARSPPLARK